MGFSELKKEATEKNLPLQILMRGDTEGRLLLHVLYVQHVAPIQRF
jgi:hypothetical protein